MAMASLGSGKEVSCQGACVREMTVSRGQAARSRAYWLFENSEKCNRNPRNDESQISGDGSLRWALDNTRLSGVA